LAMYLKDTSPYGELDYRNIFKTVREIGYRGYVGFEFECLGKSDEAAIQDVFELIR